MPLISIPKSSSMLKKYFFSSLKFVVPFLLWLFLFRDFITGKITVINDSFSFHGLVNFYLNNMRSGVYPLWNPYVLWGAPQEINLRQIGEYNPILFLMLLFNHLGLRFYHAFTLVLSAYYFTGLIGFYLLVKTALKDSVVAYAAFLMLLFSSVGMTMFAQVMMLLLYVPCVWFFYFLFRFTQSWQKIFLFGLTSSLVVVLTTYLPFYFLTVFILFVAIFLFLYPRDVRNIWGEFVVFARSHGKAVVLCAVVLILAIAPTWLAYRATFSPDAVIQTRHADDASTLSKGSVMAYDELKRGLSDKMSGRQLFSDLNDVPYDNDGFAYVPFFAYLVLFVSLGTVLNKRAVFLMVWGFLLLLIGLTNATPVHRFLFEHVFYFKLFRNLYFLLPFLISIFIAFAAEQLRLFFEIEQRSQRQKYLMVLLISAIFLLFFFFLRTRGDIIFSTYLTLGLGYVFFVGHITGLLKVGQKTCLFCMAVLIMVQPIEVLGAYAKNARSIESPIIRDGIAKEYRKPLFSFMRPEYPRGGDIAVGELEQTYRFNWHVLSMQDSPGFIAYRYSFPTRWSYMLSQRVDKDALRGYVKNKFLVYDNVAVVKDIDFNDLKQALKTGQNTAFVLADPSNKGWVSPAKENDPTIKEASAIQGDSDQLHILKFDANALKLHTHFDREKFLVYNDSFHSDWKVFVNGRKAPLYRANYAFKGVWLPKGENVVLFRYMPVPGEWFYKLLGLCFFAFFILTACSFCCGTAMCRE